VGFSFFLFNRFLLSLSFVGSGRESSPGCRDGNPASNQLDHPASLSVVYFFISFVSGEKEMKKFVIVASNNISHFRILFFNCFPGVQLQDLLFLIWDFFSLFVLFQPRNYDHEKKNKL